MRVGVWQGVHSLTPYLYYYDPHAGNINITWKVSAILSINKTTEIEANELHIKIGENAMRQDKIIWHKKLKKVMNIND